MKYMLGGMFALLAVTAVANGGVIFATGNNPQTDEPVLFHDSCIGCVDGPGMLVTGHTQSTNLLVNLATTGQLVAIDVGHNTVTTPGDVGFTDLGISIPGYGFSSIILDLTSLPTMSDGTVTFAAYTNSAIFATTLLLSHTGGNYYTITTDPGTAILRLDMTTSVLQHDISQIRIGGIEPIPEPAEWGIVAGALIAIGLWHRNRRG